MTTYRLHGLPKTVNPALIVTATLLLISVIVPVLFREEFLRYGENLLKSYGQDKIDLILNIVTVISISPVALRFEHTRRSAPF